MARYKIGAEVVVLLVLIVLNLRGVKESVTILAPIFLVFIGTHAFAILYVFALHATGLPGVFAGAAREFHASAATMGFGPLAFVLLRAYSMGGGTYTGIEAVMGLAAIAALLYTRGDITMLVVVYSINVFLTFSLTELGMARHWIVDRHKEPRWSDSTTSSFPLSRSEFRTRRSRRWTVPCPPRSSPWTGSPGTVSTKS